MVWAVVGVRVELTLFTIEDHQQVIAGSLAYRYYQIKPARLCIRIIQPPQAKCQPPMRFSISLDVSQKCYNFLRSETQSRW